jgi:NADH:ubiquinone oxidoreductase subunit F (NADH-binding)
MPQVDRILDREVVDDLDGYVRAGGGSGLHAALHRSQESIVELVERSGLRGRGGAGFPTGRKWRSVAGRRSTGTPPVVVNAAEGEPGTFKDRILLRRNPYAVLEGALVAAVAIGADEIVVACKASFTHELDRLRTAFEELERAGWTTGFRLRIVEGPGEYLFGEETGLLEVVEGRPPFPRVMAPYRRGLGGRDTGTDGASARRPPPTDGPVALVDNVETLANVPGILHHGVDWYRELGTERSPGTIICTVTGDTRRDGVGEFAMGTTLREVIESLGAGVGPGREIAAVLSGVSNPPLSAGQLDIPLTYEHMAALGTGLGSGSFIVIDDQTPLRAVAAGVARFLATESCGQCEPCKRDGLAIAAGLRGPSGDLADVEDHLSTVARGARCALAGQTERVVGRLLELGAAAGRPSVDQPAVEYPIVPLVDLVGGHAVLDSSHLDKRPDWTHADEQPDSDRWPVHRLADRPVEITPTETHELDDSGPWESDDAPDPFAPLHELQDRLDDDLRSVRAAPPAQVNSRLRALRLDLERHRRATERLIYPLTARLSPDSGDDVVWFPERHEQHAARLLERLDLDLEPVSPSLVDELCADVHASIIELDERVLPLLRDAIADDPDELLRLAAGITEEITDAP